MDEITLDTDLTALLKPVTLGTSSGGVNLYGSQEGSFGSGLGANLGLGDTGTSFLDSLGGIGGIAKGVGLASSLYSDYMQGKYLNKSMDVMDANLKMAQQANDTHYSNAAGFDSYSSNRSAVA